MENAKLTSIQNRTTEILEKVTNFINLPAPEQPDISGEIKTEIGKTRQQLAAVMQEKSIKDANSINELIGLINSKEYKPEIKLKTDSPEVIAEVNNMRKELIGALKELKLELSKKKTYRHTVSRDNNDLIETITSVTL